MPRRRLRPAKPFPILPGVRQTSPSSFPQYFPFEFSEYCEQASHRSSGGCGQIQSLSERNEPDTQMLQFLECCQQICYGSAPTVQPPHQDGIDLPATCGLSQLFAGLPSRRSRANLTDLHDHCPAEAFSGCLLNR